MPYTAAQAIANIKDYSQDHEQVHILKALEGISRGKFLDIGAYHPTELSNTRALYELGWEGVMVEPSPAPMLSLLKEYSQDQRIQLIQGLVVPESEGGVRPMVITNGPYSTIDPKTAKKWGQHKSVGYYGSLFIPVIPIESLLSSLGPFDFIDFDVEGGSKDLFTRMLDLNIRPRCVCVEYDDYRAEIEIGAKTSGYKQVYVNATNIIFARPLETNE
jgi:hypothetical protein